jgi:hypothetical protein
MPKLDPQLMAAIMAANKLANDDEKEPVESEGEGMVECPCCKGAGKCSAEDAAAYNSTETPEGEA